MQIHGLHQFKAIAKSQIEITQLCSDNAHHFLPQQHTHVCAHDASLQKMDVLHKWHHPNLKFQCLPTALTIVTVEAKTSVEAALVNDAPNKPTLTIHVHFSALQYGPVNESLIFL